MQSYSHTAPTEIRLQSLKESYSSSTISCPVLCPDPAHYRLRQEETHLQSYTFRIKEF